MINTLFSYLDSPGKRIFINCSVPDFKKNRFVKAIIFTQGQIVKKVMRHPGLSSQAIDPPGLITLPAIGPGPLKIFRLKNNSCLIDAKGLIVSPGLIDVHSHGDSAVFSPENPKIPQGVTTEITGNCGLSAIDFSIPQAGQSRESRPDIHGFKNLYTSIWGDFPLNMTFKSIKNYYQAVEEKAYSRAKMLMGCSSVRLAAVGLKNRPPTKKELKTLENIVQTGFDQGAAGISFGMNYVPNSFCTRAEYTLLSTLAYKNNKKLVFHIRDEGDFLIESLEEALDIALESGAGLHISHLKCHGKQNWHKTEEVLKFIDRACRLLDFTFDSQPYTSGATTLFAILPPKHLELPAEDLNAALQDDKCLDEIERTIHKGITGWDNYYKSTGPENIVPTGLMHRDNMALKGLSLAEAALICGCSPLRAAARILLLEGSRAGMILNARSEESVIKFLAHPLGMVGSDALYGPDPHPRTHGAFPRYLGCYVREKKIATPIESLYKLTAFPARVFGLKNAGRLEKGSFSDLFIFDPEKIGHYPDSESACPAKPRGIYYVLSKGREYLFPL